MVNAILEIIAKSPPAILCALGGIGLLLQMSGAGWLLALGVGLQIAWLAL